MKQIITMLKLDTKLILRDKLAAYLVLAPVIMSLLIMIVLTTVDNNRFRIAVTADLPAAVSDCIGSYADIETVENLSALEKRVNAFDSIAGLYWKQDTLQVLFQGNEGSDYETAVRHLIDTAMYTTPAVSANNNSRSGQSLLTQVIIGVLLTAPAAIGGIVSGFNLVTEKESFINRAYRVAPLSVHTYLLSRCLIAVLVGLINLTGIALIFGLGQELPLIFLATFFALPLFAWSPILIGGIAKDKMGSLSMIKVIMLIFICIPIGAALTPSRFRFFFYPLPMYWHYKTIESVLQGRFHLLYGTITFLISGAILLLLTRIVGKTLQKG